MNQLKKGRLTLFHLLQKTSPVIASKLLYYRKFNKRLNLKNPQTFNEKLMWLKLYEEDTLKTICADKFLVRNYIRRAGLSHLLVDLIEVYDHAEQIDFRKLPSAFMMKCTHGSGLNLACHDKNQLNELQVKETFKMWKNCNYALVNCEPHYAKIEPRIVVEKLLVNQEDEPIDYQIHCFHGKPQLIEVIIKGQRGKKDYITLSPEWYVLHYNAASARFHETLKKPRKLAEMLGIARELSHEFTYVRVDLYYCQEEIYFGELTFTPDACLDVDFFDEAQLSLGKLLDLEPKKQTHLAQTIGSKLS